MLPFCLITCLAMTAFAADLSPTKWDPAAKSKAESQEQTVFPAKARLIEGHSGLISATLSPNRVPNDMAPVIVMAGARAVMAVASVGASLTAETVRILLGTLGNRLDLQTVMEAPPLLYNFRAPKAGETALHRTQLVPETAYSPDFIHNLEASGIASEKKSRIQVLTIKGTAVVGAFDLETAIWRTVETPLLFDFADAY
jgi:hypothetical protein